MGLKPAVYLCAVSLNILTHGNTQEAEPQKTIGTGAHQVNLTLPATRSHPGLFLNQRELDDIRAQIKKGTYPITGWYQSIKSRAGAPFGPLHNGTDIVETKRMFRAYSEIPLNNALVYQIDGDAAAAQTARNMLMDFAQNTLKSITEVNGQLDMSFTWMHRFTDPGVGIGNNLNELGTENAALELSLAFTDFAFAYDLIYNSDALSAADKRVIEDYLQRGYVLIREGSRAFVEGRLRPPHNQSPHWANGGQVNRCHQYSNHVTAHVAALASIGFLLNCEYMVNQSVVGDDGRVPHSWSDLVEQSIYTSNDLVIGCDSNERPVTYDGEIVDRYRMQQKRGFLYSLLSYKNLLLVAEAARRKGIDLYRFQAPGGENLKLPATYYAPIQNKFIDPGTTAAQKIDYPVDGPGRDPVGREYYNGDIARFQNFYIFELLSQSLYADRDVDIVFDRFNLLSENDEDVKARRKYHDTLFFGKYYTQQEFKWNFHLDDFAEYWEADANIENFKVSSGVLSFDTASSDPIVRNASLNLKANDYKYFDVRMRLTKLHSAVPTSSVAQIFLANGDKSSVYAPIDAQWRTVSFPVSTLPGWMNTIREIRLDPTNRYDVKVEIESIEIYKETRR